MACQSLSSKWPAAKARRENMSSATCDRGAGPFSTQPSGPQFFGRISASLARPVSQWIQALRSLLEIRPNSLRRLASHTGYTTLVGLLLRRCLFLPGEGACPRKVSYEFRSEAFGSLASRSVAVVRSGALAVVHRILM